MSELRYNPSKIEPKWQKLWEDERSWEVSNESSAKQRSYVLEMLPYPSGEPHIGHLKCYSVGDAIAHFHRRIGRDVLHPMGYDAFGLPAENHAIKTGVHPRVSTAQSIKSFQRQFREWGISIDWSREFGTHEPSYYRWTQWIFLKLYERGLAYQKEAAVKWCPKDQTVLANEQVVDGKCERCGSEVEIKHLRQWFFRITDYADRLIDDLEDIDWPQNVKTMQRNWIGRSEGAEVVFSCKELDIDYPVFTTRPDTLFGATFFVMAPEHPDVLKLSAGTEHEEEVRKYVNQSMQQGNEQRGAVERPKTGVPLGRTVTNPVNGAELPVYVADYVLMEYGTGAIMAVPAHDERDYDFAVAKNLPIKQVIDGGEIPYSGDGPLINCSSQFDGKPNREAYKEIVTWLESEGRGHESINYRLRDWLVSRQRYWGCPIPVIYCDSCGSVPVPEADLPVKLPDIEDYAPQGHSPLAGAKEWLEVRCPECKAPAKRETDTMDTFVDSSWYYLRYCDANNENQPWDKDVLDEWMPVNQYIGGVEHAVLHLMYARFFTKALADMDYLNFEEPFKSLFTQGMVTRDGAKMSKSRGNVVSPAEYVKTYGADTARCYVLFVGPPEQDADFSDEGVEGVNRFLSRLWRLSSELSVKLKPQGEVVPADRSELSEPELQLVRKANWAIQKVTHDMTGGRFGFNTAIAAVMELTNECSKLRDEVSGQSLAFALQTAGSLIFPFAPHLGSEVYELMTGEHVWKAPWPQADESLLEVESFELVCQVNGKVRDRVEASVDASEDELKELALAQPNIKSHLEGKTLIKEIVVPGKLVNLVVK